jgi:hypothetical protein
VLGAGAPARAQNTPPATSRGSEKAPITILVFSDFESFPCARSASVIDGLLQQTRDVRVIFKHAPAASNPNALLAHEAALAGGAQGKFWEMHDTLFENQTHLTRADLLGYAKSLGLDLAAFERALDSHTYRPIVERDLAEAAGLGVTTTPTFFVNARRLVGPQGYASLKCVPGYEMRARLRVSTFLGQRAVDTRDVWCPGWRGSRLLSYPSESRTKRGKTRDKTTTTTEPPEGSLAKYQARGVAVVLAVLWARPKRLASQRFAPGPPGSPPRWQPKLFYSGGLK